jgi:hypothetical protein
MSITVMMQRMQTATYVDYKADQHSDAFSDAFSVVSIKDADGSQVKLFFAAGQAEHVAAAITEAINNGESK